jgi:hypothetical protein
VISDYNAHGNRTKITHPGGKFVVDVYDTADRLVRLFENGGESSSASGPR